MKYKVIVFLCLSVLSLLVVPAVNFSRGNMPLSSIDKWIVDRSVMYNTDFALPILSKTLYPLGISISPGSVVVGKKGWMFLGDSEQNAISVHRDIGTDTAEKSAQIAISATAWNEWLKGAGVKKYVVMLSADKSSIYPEELPAWARADGQSRTDVLINSTDPAIYLDTRKILLAEKANSTSPLYYKTDTHWNTYGGWTAFQAMAKMVSSSENPPVFPGSGIGVVRSVDSRIGGDLSRFLRIQQDVVDQEVRLAFDDAAQIDTTLFNYDTGELIRSGGNTEVPSILQPTIVHSDSALNQKRVLWLRDSFGAAMAPFMAATFSDVLQVHYNRLDAASFMKVVDDFKPDYVIVTVVERSAFAPIFMTMPADRAVAIK